MLVPSGMLHKIGNTFIANISYCNVKNSLTLSAAPSLCRSAFESIARPDITSSSPRRALTSADQFRFTRDGPAPAGLKLTRRRLRESNCCRSPPRGSSKSSGQNTTKRNHNQQSTFQGGAHNILPIPFQNGRARKMWCAFVVCVCCEITIEFVCCCSSSSSSSSVDLLFVPDTVFRFMIVTTAGHLGWRKR